MEKQREMVLSSAAKKEAARGARATGRSAGRYRKVQTVTSLTCGSVRLQQRKLRPWDDAASRISFDVGRAMGPIVY